jgi:hypothetical protein
MTPLERYVAAWIAHDPEQIADAVTEDCTVTECYGPVYHGRSRVRQWADTWFRAGGVVHRWTITDHFAADGREAAQWVFECTWQDSRDSFEGCTIAAASGDCIDSLREYQTTAPLYDWKGTWR